MYFFKLPKSFTELTVDHTFLALCTILSNIANLTKRKLSTCPHMVVTYVMIVIMLTYLLSCLFQVHRLDRESSGLLLMGRTKETFARLHWLFANINLAKSSSQVYADSTFIITGRFTDIWKHKNQWKFGEESIIICWVKSDPGFCSTQSLR